MARPLKAGLEYFPLDVKLNDKVKIIESIHGLEGFAILIKLYQKIYSEGYCMKWEEKEQILFSNSISVGKKEVMSLVDDCIKWDIFDEDMYKKYKILTSSRIQKQYVNSVYKRTKVKMVKEYLLIDVSDSNNIIVTGVSDTGNSDVSIVSDSKSTQSKVDNSKVNNKVKDSIEKDSNSNANDTTITTESNNNLDDHDNSIHQNNIELIKNHYLANSRNNKYCTKKDEDDIELAYLTYLDVNFILETISLAAQENKLRKGKNTINSFSYFLPILEEQWLIGQRTEGSDGNEDVGGNGSNDFNIDTDGFIYQGRKNC